ncbi:hypothetical protein CL629_04000, partial [bacterium]|nr:hypothetical protein [bacterium]
VAFLVSVSTLAVATPLADVSLRVSGTITFSNGLPAVGFTVDLENVSNELVGVIDSPTNSEGAYEGAITTFFGNAAEHEDVIRVTATSPSGEISWSTEAIYDDPTEELDRMTINVVIPLPSSPSGLEIDVQTTLIGLDWVDNSGGIAETVIYRGIAPGLPDEQIAVVPAGITEFIDEDIAPETVYVYAISSRIGSLISLPEFSPPTESAEESDPITGVVIEGSSVVQSGDSITVVAHGSPGENATITVPGVGTENMAADPDNPTTYRLTITVSDELTGFNDGTYDVPVVVQIGNRISNVTIPVTVDNSSPEPSISDGEVLLGTASLPLAEGETASFADGTPYTGGALGPGNYEITIRDEAGNETTTSFRVRAPNPPTLSDLQGSPDGAAVDLDWAGSAAYFRVAADGIIVAYSISGTDRVYTVSPVSQGASHTFEVTGIRDGQTVRRSTTVFVPVDTPVTDVEIGSTDVRPGETVSVSASGALDVPASVRLVASDGSVVYEETLTGAGDVYSGMLSLPSNLPDDDYDLVVDIGGEISTTEDALRVDSDPPTAPTPRPSDSPAVAGESFTRQIETEPGSTVIAEASGLGTITVVEVSPGIFDLTIPASEAGSYSVDLTVTDTAGNSSMTSLEISVEEPDEPISEVEVGIVGPTQPGSTIPISWSGGGDTASARVIASDGTVVLEQELRIDADGNVSGEIILPANTQDGDYNLELTSGNRTEVSENIFTVDGTAQDPPEITRTPSVQDGLLGLQATAEPGSTVVAEILGLIPDVGPITLDEGEVAGSFEAEVQLDPMFSGHTVIAITATDDAGNSSSSEKAFVVPVQTSDYTIFLHPGNNMIYVPVMDAGIRSLSDLYYRLGGSEYVGVIVALKTPRAFTGFTKNVAIGSRADVRFEDQIAAIVVMKKARQETFTGPASSGRITLQDGMSIIGIPRNGEVQTVEDLSLKSDAISVVIREEGGRFLSYPPSNALIRGDKAYLVVSTASVTFTIDGGMWLNDFVASIASLEVFSARRIPETVEDVVVDVNAAIREGQESLGRPFVPVSFIPTPPKTALLQNYPNPFNPETWIPFQLSKDSSVLITIYAKDGRVVRILDLGHLSADSYTRREQAAYWDGTNEAGERVASGLYFYRLRAGKYTAGGRMLLSK